MHADNFSADHSYVNTWYYMLQRYFWHPGNDTDLVVISFVSRSLYDRNELEIGQLAWFFTTMRDWPEVLTTEQAAAFLQCSTQYLEIARCKGGGPPYSKVGSRLIRYQRTALLQWLEKRQVTSTSEPPK